MVKCNTNKEIWKDVTNYEGYYQISNAGRVKSLKRKHVPKDTIVKGSITTDGYKQVQLRKNGRVETRLISSLLKEHFPNKDNIKTNVFCAVCNGPLHRKPSELKRNVTGLFFCSKECDAVLRSQRKIEHSLVSIQQTIGNQDFKEWLLREYVTKNKSTQEISLELYGTKRNDTSVCDWLRRFDIPVRNGVGKGEEHWKYNFDKTDEERVINRRYPEYTDWRKSVFERDDYTCCVCGEKGGRLNAHHLYGYDKYKELRTSLNNGITLCEQCHKSFHDIYGRGNNTEKQFIEYKKQASNK